MTLGELLKAQLRDPHNQKSVAMAWLGRAQKLGQSWSPSTIESHLSRCFGERPPGVRFFFEDHERARLLLDVMEVPESDRAPIHAAAEELLMMDKDRPPRLIVDVTAYSGRVDARRLFEAVRTAIVEPRPMEPVLLLLTEVQYDDLPRSFDQHEAWLRVEMVAAAVASARAAELASAGALVASFRRHSPPERWLAMDVDLRTGRLVFEPADGLERFAREGSLPLPAVVHDLSHFVGDDPIPQLDLAGLGPLEQRRAMVDLASEDHAERVAKDPVRRLATARTLGVTAAATERDRVEAELRSAVAGLGAATVSTMDAESFDALLARARRRPQPPTMARVGDQIHVINPEAHQPGLDHRRVQLHRIDAAEPALTRLRTAVNRWTLGDFEADPFLDRLISRLDPDGHEHRAFVHARAVLLARTLSPQRGRLVADWRAALERLLAHDVPPARLRLIVDPSRSLSQYVTVNAPPWAKAALHGVSTDVSVLEFSRSALANAVPISREATVRVAQRTEGDRYGYSRQTVELEIPDGDATSPGVTGADERWLDLFDAWSSGAELTVSVRPGEPLRALPWQQADLHLGLTWLALRTALRTAPAVRLHDGAVLVQIADGLAARVEVRETSGALELGASLDAVCSQHDLERWTLGVGVASGVSSVRLSVPQRVILLGEQVRAEVEFLGAPLLAGANVHGTLIAANQEEDERSWSDDDD